ncbi:hypothetical protein [Polaribacter sp. Hel_I_88]|uniref:hypothetical protein n=1 Tax=Polaribacter sp. Hel_I_88 TaxID=1250006 RepID=UPI00047E272A|nr:hypothetical protein [Polaribacter sp. Hel_I_88]
MKNNVPSLFKLIDILIKNQENIFDSYEIKNFNQLLNLNVVSVRDTNSKKAKVNFNSEFFNSQLLSYAELKLNKKMEIDISNSMLFADEFEKYLKKNNKTKYLNQYDYLINSFKSWIIIFLNNENNLDVNNFLLELPEEHKEREKHLDLFERYFFRALPYIDLSVELTYNTLVYSFVNERHSHNAFQYLEELTSEDLSKAIKLYEYGVENNIFNNISFSGNLLLGMYRNGYLKAYDISKKLFGEHEKIALFFFGRINYTNDSNIEEIINFIDKVDLTKQNNLNECVYFYENLLKLELNDKLNKKCFEKFREYYEKGDENEKKWIIYNLSWHIKGFEKERYEFLHFVLKTVKKPSFLKEYFGTFVDPKHFFHFFYISYAKHGFQTDLNYFEGGINHFWENSKTETELHLLELISQENKIIRTGTIKLMLLGNCDINLLNLKTEIAQLRTVETIIDFPHSFNLILPMLLCLRKSKFKRVINEIQNGLSEMIVNSYHDELFNWIKESIGKNVKDMRFIKPIKSALESYHKIKEIKNGNRHIDPIENERGLADLYYRLEHENKAKMIREINKGDNSFLSAISKSIIVVRGNSWKSENNDEISPLNKIESSSYIDIKAFKNPDLFEYNLNNPKSKF